MFNRYVAVCASVAIVIGCLWHFLEVTSVTITADTGIENFAERLDISNPKIISWLFPYIAILGTVGLICMGYWVRAVYRKRRSPLQIVFVADNARYVQTKGGHQGTAFSRYYVDVFNRTNDRPVYDIKVTWNRTRLTSYVDREIGRVALHNSPKLDPQEHQLVYLFGIVDKTLHEPNSWDVLERTSKFVVRARGRNAAEVIAEFEYSPLRMPKIRRIR
jgi:hypothetical protein